MDPYNRTDNKKHILNAKCEIEEIFTMARQEEFRKKQELANSMMKCLKIAKKILCEHKVEPKKAIVLYVN